METEEIYFRQRKRHIPLIDERQITDFDICLRRLGSWNTTGKSALHDGAAGIIRLQWIIPDERWCDEEGMLQFLDLRLHRQVLRWFLHSSPLSKDERFFLRDGWSGWSKELRTTWRSNDLAQAVGRNSEELLPILRFLTLQEYLVKNGEGVWMSGPRLASIYNIGATLEWCVQAHFQRRHQAIARRCVHFKEWEPLGINDLDILAFPNNLVFLAECKSSTDITLGQITRFVKRAQAFPADIALLLIDTDSLLSVATRVKQIKTILGRETHEEEQTQQDGSLIVFLPPNICVANIGESISHTLESILHLGHIHIKSRPD